MKERPILFSDAMVCAILADRKTQTRRLARSHRADPTLMRGYCDVGDRLWVREAWSTEGRSLEEARARHEDALPSLSSIYYRATESYPESLTWRPSIFMPRWACRVMLDVVAVRLVPLQSISEDDAQAEGVTMRIGGSDRPCAHGFAALWDSINGERAPWSSNPWVWAITFKRVS